MITYKHRFYPSAAQKRQLAIEFGNARFVWNRMLSVRKKTYKRRAESSNNVSLTRLLTKLKKTNRFCWLQNSTAVVLTQVLINQDRAFTNFFAKRADYPKFKSRKYAQSIRYQLDQRCIHSTFAPGKLLKLPKLGALKLRWTKRYASTAPKMVTLSKDSSGRYFVSMSVEKEICLLPVIQSECGVDRGISDIVVTSDGYKSGTPEFVKNYAARKKRLQRKLSGQIKGSNRREKTRLKLSRIHARIADVRNQWCHIRSNKLINENQVIRLEDLNVKGMMRNHHLARAIASSVWGELKRQLEYKASWYGRSIEIIDRWYPSSKMCSDCHYVVDKLPLSQRHWTCPNCGSNHDRDINAAKNIKQYPQVAGNLRTGRAA